MESGNTFLTKTYFPGKKIKPLNGCSYICYGAEVSFHRLYFIPDKDLPRNFNNYQLKTTLQIFRYKIQAIFETNKGLKVIDGA